MRTLGGRLAGWSVWLVPVALLASLAVLYGATAQTDDKVSVDVYSSSLASWRIATTGTPWLDDFDTTRIDGYGDLEDEVVFIREAPNGHRVPHRLPGVIVAPLPAYLLAGGDTSPESFSLAPEALSAAGLTAGSVTLFFLAVRRQLGNRDALVASLVLGFCTPVWSVAANAMWTHTVAVFGLCGMAWAAARDRWWLVGAFGGVALWGRLHVALIVALLGLGVAILRRRPAVAVQVGSVSTAFLLAASAWTRWAFGTWTPTGGYSAAPGGTLGSGRYPDPSPLTNQLGLWVSPDRGVLVWTPVLVLLLPAVLRSWKHLPDWARLLAAGGVAYLLVQGQLNYFHGGGAHYGYRLGLEFLVCVAPAYALSVRRSGAAARALLGPLLGLQFAAIALGAVFDAPAPAESYGWRDNAFAFAVREAPVLAVIALLVVVVGWLLGRMLQAASPRPPVSPG